MLYSPYGSRKNLQAPQAYLEGENPTTSLLRKVGLSYKESVKCIFYDLDDQIIATPTLYPGDASFTLEGGHNIRNPRG